MSTATSKKKLLKEKKTEVLRGRCEPRLKGMFDDFVAETAFSESHWVRVAIAEFMRAKGRRV